MTMRPLMPTPQPPHETVPSVVLEEAFGLSDPAQAVTDFIRTQQALGASRGIAVGLAAEALGYAAVAPLLEAARAGMRSQETLLHLLDDVAKVSPVTANAALNGFLADEWIRVVDADGVKGLRMMGRDWIASFPDDLKVEGWMDIGACPSLASLPSRMDVRGDLHVRDCAALCHVGNGLRVAGNLALNGCGNLRSLPSDMQVAGGWSLDACTSLAALPEGTKVAQRLSLQDCAALTGLPAGLCVGGYLDLEGCTSLERLPMGLDVRGDIFLATECGAWDGRIPDDARIGGKIVTDRNPYPGITLDVWRDIYPHGERA